MTDALDRVTDQESRRILEKLRESLGARVATARLRDSIPGFKGMKGIYKPSGSPHALWVRQTLRGAYPDKDRIPLTDGSWVYHYAPEGRNGVTDMTLDTNQSLLQCMRDRVPVGVLIQVDDTPKAGAYQMLGLAMVEEYNGVYFVLRGEPIAWDEPAMSSAQPPPFHPYDKEARAVSEVVRAAREERFKWAIRSVYHEKCCVCELGFRVGGRLVGLEAAHIVPFSDFGTSKDVRNGLLLCRNHHSLFDSWAWTLDEDYRVKITADTEFRRSALPNHVLKLEGARLPNLPDLEVDLPAREAIAIRMDQFDRAATEVQ